MLNLEFQRAILRVVISHESTSSPSSATISEGCTVPKMSQFVCDFAEGAEVTTVVAAPPKSVARMREKLEKCGPNPPPRKRNGKRNRGSAGVGGVGGGG